MEKNNSESSINPLFLEKAYLFIRSQGKVHTKTDLAAAMEANSVTISRAFSGKKGYLTKDFLIRFNSAFGNIFNMSYLMRGEGEMLAVSESGNNIVQGDNNHHFNQSVSASTDNAVERLNEALKAKEDKIRMLEKMVEDKDKEIDFLRQLITNR